MTKDKSWLARRPDLGQDRRRLVPVVDAVERQVADELAVEHGHDHTVEVDPGLFPLDRQPTGETGLVVALDSHDDQLHFVQAGVLGRGDLGLGGQRGDVQVAVPRPGRGPLAVARIFQMCPRPRRAAGACQKSPPGSSLTSV